MMWTASWGCNRIGLCGGFGRWCLPTCSQCYLRSSRAFSGLFCLSSRRDFFCFFGMVFFADSFLGTALPDVSFAYFGVALSPAVSLSFSVFLLLCSLYGRSRRADFSGCLAEFWLSSDLASVGDSGVGISVCFFCVASTAFTISARLCFQGSFVVSFSSEGGTLAFYSANTDYLLFVEWKRPNLYGQARLRGIIFLW